jgi:ElaB/YqjD/DUF883 family membrane-anchored ribosome-binding protein
MNTNKTTNHVDDNNISQRIQEAGDRLVELKNEVTGNLGKRIDSLDALVKERPLAALGVALGIGYLLARLLHR